MTADTVNDSSSTVPSGGKGKYWTFVLRDSSKKIACISLVTEIEARAFVLRPRGGFEKAAGPVRTSAKTKSS